MSEEKKSCLGCELGYPIADDNDYLRATFPHSRGYHYTFENVGDSTRKYEGMCSVNRESVSAEPPRCISCQQPLMSRDGKSWCSTSGCFAQFQPIGAPPRAEPPKIKRHKIGCARTIETAILVTQYLKDRCCAPLSSIHRDMVSYAFTNPTPENGCWTADIIVTVNDFPDTECHEFVNVCRAFVAGRGEIWT